MFAFTVKCFREYANALKALYPWDFTVFPNRVSAENISTKKDNKPFF